MGETEWYPLLFTPVYKDYLWGGDRILRAFQRDVPQGVCAESWEVSGHPDGMSVVRNGRLAGVDLAMLARGHARALMGTRVRGDTFPLLMKLIDANERLSVQVHPDDEAAARFGGEAKTELWYLLEADPEASVFAGLRPGVTEAVLREAIAAGLLEELLCRVPVSKGDALFIPGGRIHAVDGGCLVLEVQQSSNTTYRIHDWGRVGPDGKARALHVDQAVRTVRWTEREEAKVTPVPLPETAGGERLLMYASPYFRVERWRLTARETCEGAGETFQIFFVAEGDVHLSWDGGSIALAAGTSCLAPAALPAFELAPAGEAVVLQVTVP